MRSGAGRGTARTVAFRAEDPPEDRWHALALLVVSLATEADASGPPEREETAPRYWVSVVADFGDGLEPGPSRFGGTARLAYRPRGSPAYFSIGAGYATSSRTAYGVRPSFLPLSVGVGGVFELDPMRLALRPRLDFVIERQGAEVAGLQAGDSGSRWLPGIAGSLELVLPTGAPLAVVFGASGRFFRGATAIRVEEQRVGAFPAHSYGMHLGLELSFDALFGPARD